LADMKGQLDAKVRVLRPKPKPRTKRTTAPPS
jgi:hypothetical protein